MKFRRLFWIAVTGVVLSLSCNRLVPSETETPAEPSVIPVNALTLETADNPVEVRTFTGIVKPRRVSTLTFSQAGVIDEIVAEVGDTVSVGQTLAELQTEDLSADRTRLEDAISKTKAAIKTLQEQANQLTPEQSRAKIADLRNRLLQVEQDLNRAATGGEQPTNIAERLNAVETETGQLDRRVLQAQIAELDKQLRDQNQSLETIKRRLEQSQLIVPFAGVITNRLANVGEAVRPGVPIAKLMETGSLLIHVGVPRELAASFDVGESLLVGDGDTEGLAEVVAKLPMVDALTGVQTVLLRPPNERADVILPGMTVIVRINRPILEPVLWVPLTALAGDSGGVWSVFLVEDDSKNDDPRINRRPVRVVHFADDRAWIQGDLRVGDQLVTDGLHRLVSGQRVRIARTSTPPPASGEAE